MGRYGAVWAVWAWVWGGVGVLSLGPKLFKFPRNAAVFGALDACSACACDLSHLQCPKIAHLASVWLIIFWIGLEVGELGGAVCHGVGWGGRGQWRAG